MLTWRLNYGGAVITSITVVIHLHITTILIQNSQLQEAFMSFLASTCTINVLLVSDGTEKAMALEPSVFEALVRIGVVLHSSIVH